MSGSMTWHCPRCDAFLGVYRPPTQAQEGRSAQGRGLPLTKSCRRCLRTVLVADASSEQKAREIVERSGYDTPVVLPRNVYR
jgi:hypothetical protein